MREMWHEFTRVRMTAIPIPPNVVFHLGWRYSDIATLAAAYFALDVLEWLVRA